MSEKAGYRPIVCRTARPSRRTDTNQLILPEVDTRMPKPVSKSSHTSTRLILGGGNVSTKRVVSFLRMKDA